MRPEIAKINETRFVESLRVRRGKKKIPTHYLCLGFETSTSARFFFNFKSDLTQREACDALRRSGTKPQLIVHAARRNGSRARVFILRVSMSGRRKR